MTLSGDLRDWYLQIIEDRLTEDERPLGRLIPFPVRTLEGGPTAEATTDERTAAAAAPTGEQPSPSCAVCGGLSCEFCRRVDA